MEKFVCTKSGKIGKWKDKIKAGQEFDVLRTIRNECVLIPKDEGMNIIARRRDLVEYGEFSGKPELGG